MKRRVLRDMGLHALSWGSGVRLSFGRGVGVRNGAGPVIDMFMTVSFFPGFLLLILRFVYTYQTAK